MKNPLNQRPGLLWVVPDRILVMGGIVSGPEIPEVVKESLEELTKEKINSIVVQFFLKKDAPSSLIKNERRNGVLFLFIPINEEIELQKKHLRPELFKKIDEIVNIFKPYYVALLKNSITPFSLRKLLENRNSAVIFEMSEASFSEPINLSKSEDFFGGTKKLIDSLVEVRKKVFTPEHSQKSLLRVACVMDEFTYFSYKDVCELKQLSIQNWLDELQEFKPQVLFIESAWRGLKDEWNRKISSPSEELIGVVEWCDQNNVKTVFWNKEDPVHYGTFLNTAKLFQFVFTTDINCVANYKRDLGHEDVYILPFGCNPLEHNPIEKFERKNGACFAGSYYVRYPERIKNLDTLLEVCRENGGIDIYDRNFGKIDDNYKFPEKYSNDILGNLQYFEIDKAYKGYTYGVNLNSIKNSQTMFARRVYELMASNTIVVSNYSLGVMTQFGDLTISSDSKDMLERKMKNFNSNKNFCDLVRLRALRKVLTEHTYESRFNYLCEKIFSIKVNQDMPMIHVLACIDNLDELSSAVEIVNSQIYKNTHLVILSNVKNIPEIKNQNASIFYTVSEYLNYFKNLPNKDFIAYINSSNFYGRYYLLDLINTIKFSSSSIFVKANYYSCDKNGVVTLNNDSRQYSYVDTFSLERGLLGVKNPVSKQYQGLNAFDKKFFERDLSGIDGIFNVDRFNFCKSIWPILSDLKISNEPFYENDNFNIGMPFASLNSSAEIIKASEPTKTKYGDGLKILSGLQLYELSDVENLASKKIVCEASDNSMRIAFRAGAPKHHYIYNRKNIKIDELWPDKSGKLYLETTPGLEIAPVVIFFNANGERIGHQILISNWNQVVNFPENVVSVKLGIRAAGVTGDANVVAWVFSHLVEQDRFHWTASSRNLVIVPSYPKYDDYYKYAFVHARIKNYRELGYSVDICRVNPNSNLEHYEFEGINVVSGGLDTLSTVLRSGNYQKIIIHALDRLTWEVVSKCLDIAEIYVWLHGAEIQSWKRRSFNYSSSEDQNSAKKNGERRDEFWRMLFSLNHPNLKFVFVSQYFCNEVIDDLGIALEEKIYKVINNPINTNLFGYESKSVDLRKNILTIRPFTSKVYANDLTVEVIIKLSKRDFFEELSFTIIGDGPLFDDTVKPLLKFKNVKLVKGHISQGEIATLHKKFGIFLSPSRMDTQGVSRDEAMSSGLVPITNAVGAIPEFLDTECGFICQPEDVDGLAYAIEKLYYDSALFASMSLKARKNVALTRSMDIINEQEINFLGWVDK